MTKRLGLVTHEAAHRSARLPWYGRTTAPRHRRKDTSREGAAPDTSSDARRRPPPHRRRARRPGISCGGGSQWQDAGAPRQSPRRPATSRTRVFCLKHNLTVSVENMACGEMLAEELVEKGARYPLPSEKLLRVRGGASCRPDRGGTAQQLAPPHCPGEVLLPVVDGAVATPRDSRRRQHRTWPRPVCGL